MNNDKVIEEMLARIQALEEKVEIVQVSNGYLDYLF